MRTAHAPGYLGAFDLAGGVGEGGDLAAYLLERGADYNLERLARLVEQRRVPPDSEHQRGKERVIEMLKERGVSFPATRDPRDRH